MEETENSSQEKIVKIVEKFREILNRKPEQNIWLGEDCRVEKIEEDLVVLFYKNKKGAFQPVSLRQEERFFQAKLYLEMSHTKFGRFSEITSQSVEKTVGEQIKEIVAEKGLPTGVLYARHEISDFGKATNSFYGTFPFSEISKDLELEE